MAWLLDSYPVTCQYKKKKPLKGGVTEVTITQAKQFRWGKFRRNSMVKFWEYREWAQEMHPHLVRFWAVDFWESLPSQARWTFQRSASIFASEEAAKAYQAGTVQSIRQYQATSMDDVEALIRAQAARQARHAEALER